jgi:hypothetical protein
MTVQDRSTLKAAAVVIKTETITGANTATRVGSELENIVDSVALTGDAAPLAAEYLVGTANTSLTAERVVTDTTSIVWDLATAGQAKATRPALIGDVTAPANSNTLTIAADAVTDAQLRNAGACSVIGRSANTSGDPADISAASNDTVLCRTSNALVFSAIQTAMVANDAVTNALLRNSGACSVIGRSANSSGDPADISAGSDDTVLCRTGGALSFASVSTAMIAARAVTYATIQNVSAASRLLGRGSAGGAGSPEEISLTRLTMTATTLSADIPTLTTVLGAGASAGNTTITGVKAVTFNGEVDDGSSGTAKTVDWTAGGAHKETLTGNVTFTFTAPVGVTSLVLKVVQGAGPYTIVWPASVKWAGGAAPTISTANGAVDIFSFYYDGTNYYGALSVKGAA